MIPNMSFVLGAFQTDVMLNTYERQSVDFVETMVLTSSVAIKSVVQPAQAEQLKAIGIVDFSLRYIQVHSQTELNVAHYIVYQGVSYKIITPSDYQLYGYSEVVAEEVKGDIS